MGGGGNIAPLPTPAAVAAILADRPAVAAAAAAAAAAHHRANSTDYNPRPFDSSTMLALPQTPISQGKCKIPIFPIFLIILGPRNKFKK